MSTNRESIIKLYNKNSSIRNISSILDIPKSTVQDTIKKFRYKNFRRKKSKKFYRDLGTLEDLKRSGRPRSANTCRNRKLIRDRVRRNPRISMRKVARETEIPRESVRRIAKNELGIKAYKLQKAQLLTEQNKKVRVQRCRALLQRCAGPEILFSDEKIFTIEAFHNHQNDRIWAKNSPQSDKIVTHSQHPQSVMVWAGICASGKTPLVFVNPGVKINKNYYLQEILEGVLEPWARRHFRNREWIFQQDSAPAHKAREVQAWCQAHFPDFISSQEWPPYSPDLNPMDYSVWAILEARACAKPHKNLASLKQALLREWAKISVQELRAITENFSKRLRFCIKAKGGHFESS